MNVVTREIARLQERFDALNSRERVLVVAGGITVIVALLFFGIWEPLHRGTQRVQEEIAGTQALVGRLNRAQAQAMATRGLGGPVQGQGRSLLSIVDQTGKQAGLGGAIKRMQPDSESTVRVWLEVADFAATLRWIALLNGSYGVGISAAAISRDTQAGYVRARLDFVRAP